MHLHSEILVAAADGDIRKFEVRKKQWGFDEWADPACHLTEIYLNPNGWHVRRKPTTRTVEVPDFPEPVREPLKVGQNYFLSDVSLRGVSASCYWDSHPEDLIRLKRGLIHLTKEAAIAHAKAMIAMSGGEV